MTLPESLVYALGCLAIAQTERAPGFARLLLRRWGAQCVEMVERSARERT